MFEFLVALSISSVVAYITIPRFTEINASMHRINARKFVLLDLRRAQAETVKNGCRGIVTIAANSNSYTFGCDYLAYDTNVPPQADVIIFSRTLPNSFFISSDDTIIFNSKGQIVDELGFIDSRQITLSESAHGPMNQYATGQILGTGLFEYE